MGRTLGVQEVWGLKGAGCLKDLGAENVVELGTWESGGLGEWNLGELVAWKAAVILGVHGFRGVRG